MTDYQLREASLEDLARLLKLEQNIIDSERPYYSFIKATDVTYYDIDNLIRSPESRVVLVESDNEVVGCGYAQIRASKPCHTHSHHCYLGFIYLEPDYRGKALGQRVIDDLTHWGKEQGLAHFHLDVFTENESAIRAYEKAGFSKVTTMMELVL